MKFESHASEFHGHTAGPYVRHRTARRPHKAYQGLSTKRKPAMNHLQKYLSTCLMASAALLAGAFPAAAAVAPALGAASTFAVLSAARGGTGAVTCTDSNINGDVGSSGNLASVTRTNCAIVGNVIAPVST